MRAAPIPLPAPRDGYKSPVPVLSPPSVAIVGASDRGAWPKAIFEGLRAAGYPGKIFPVNSRASTVWDMPCFPDLASLPEPPTHALVIVPAPAVIRKWCTQSRVTPGVPAATLPRAGSLAMSGNERPFP